MNSITIQRNGRGGTTEEKEIYELSEVDNEKYKLIGRAVGAGMGHCLFLGSRRTKDFWHRVYGFRIAEDEPLSQQLMSSLKEKGIEHGQYITVYFYERKAEDRYMFIPRRLEVDDRPELLNFPLNILFGSATIRDNGGKRMETAPYVPDLNTFTDIEGKQTMQYFNKLDKSKRHRVEITFDTKEKTYVGTKYRGEKNVGMAFGAEWEPFFTHLTMLGVGGNID